MRDGLEEGATDEGFGEDDPSTRPTVARETGAGPVEESESDTDEYEPTPSTTEHDTSSADEPDETTISRVDIPLIFRRDDVKDERDALSVYVTDETRRGIMDFYARADEQYPGVQKLDVYAAIVQCGIADFDAFIEQLEEMGYGWE